MMERDSKLKSLIVILFGIVGLIYLLNPTAGLFEIIPDNLPVIGNLDEAGAVMLIIAVFRYFGFDLFKKIKRKK